MKQKRRGSLSFLLIVVVVAGCKMCPKLLREFALAKLPPLVPVNCDGSHALWAPTRHNPAHIWYEQTHDELCLCKGNFPLPIPLYLFLSFSLCLRLFFVFGGVLTFSQAAFGDFPGFLFIFSVKVAPCCTVHFLCAAYAIIPIAWNVASNCRSSAPYSPI